MSARNVLVLMLLLTVAAFATTAAAGTLSVPGDHATIQAAIQASRDGDIILVNPGRFAESIDFLGKAIHVLSSHGPASTIIDAGRAGSVVVFQSGEDSEAVLEGFTLTAGSGTVVVNTVYGGAVLCDGASPTLRDNVIRDNTATFGGGIACIRGASPRILSNRFHENGSLHGVQMPTMGGALYCDGSSPEIRRNTFEDNQASAIGGAVAITASSSALLVENVIRSNHAGPASAIGGGVGVTSNAICWAEENLVELNGAQTGAGIYCGDGATLVAVGNAIVNNRNSGTGGGIALVGDTDSLIQGNFLQRNSALSGCGIYCRRSNAELLDNEIVEHVQILAFGGGIACDERSSARIQGNLIRDNEARVGAGILVGDECDVKVIANRIQNNLAQGSGAGLHCLDSILTLAGNVIAFNDARRGHGGGVYVGQTEATLANNTIAYNHARAPEPETTSGGGLFADTSIVTVVNSIFWGNECVQDPQIDMHGGSATVSMSVVEGGWPGVGNLEADPRFVAPGRHDLHLRIDSPCIDAGDDSAMLNDFDIDGDDRRIEGDGDGTARVDIGADEMRIEIAALYGTVNDASPDLADVVRVEGRVPDHERVVRLDTREPFSIHVDAPPAGPASARYVLYVWRSAPDPATATPYPRGLGWTALPTPLIANPQNQPTKVWNNLGFRKNLGEPDFDSGPAPSMPIHVPGGAPFPVVLTVQGFIQDLGSAADAPLSVTNAIVLDITDPKDG